MGRLALSVSQLNEYVRRLFQQDPLLREIELKGEISNLKWHQSGALFFTLKDEQAAVSCVMYASDAAMLQVEPFDGMRAVAGGSVGLYARGGQYQFYAKTLSAQGVGVLFERYLALKERLGREGLFDPERKRPLPAYVETVGVVSSPTGAVIHDILNVSLRRDPQASILLCPVRVQGAEAADEVVRAIHLLERIGSVSVIVLARGGGSIEDLWTFNEERVVRAVAACTKPVVSAIGHETDFTLCDFAADLRAPTPSAAAECVVPLRSELRAEVAALRRELERCAQDTLRTRRTELSLMRERLNAAHPSAGLTRAREALMQQRTSLRAAMQAALVRARGELTLKRHQLTLLSPQSVLSRGYAIVLHDGAAVTSADALEEGDGVTLVLADGRADARITKNRPEYQNGRENG